MNPLSENQLTDRTPRVIAIEINSIKDQTKRIMLASSIEIGRRLVEAKSLIEHGDWGTWLSESVAYSQSTANNLMRIFEEYGAEQLSLFGSDAKSQALGNLSYTQAVALLGIPSEEREQFVEEHDLDNMSTRELQQAIKERDQAQRKNEELTEALDSAKNHISEIAEEKDELDKTLKEIQLERAKSQVEISKLKSSMSDLQKQLNEAQTSGDTEEIERLHRELEKNDTELGASFEKIKELERQLKEKPIEVNATQIIKEVPEEVEQELFRLRERTKELEAKSNVEGNNATIKFSVHFETLVKGFGDLLGSLGEIKDTDLAAYEKYQNAVKVLIGKMEERL